MEIQEGDLVVLKSDLANKNPLMTVGEISNGYARCYHTRFDKEKGSFEVVEVNIRLIALKKIN